MVGLCGLVGRRNGSLEEMATGIEWQRDEQQVSYSDGALSIHGSHLENNEQYASSDAGDTHIWLWGEVYGFHDSDGYRPRPFEGESTPRYLTTLHDRFGLDVIPRLNGEFFAIIYDRNAGTVSLCTDRLAMRDTYYTYLSDGALAFSTQLQSLSLLPEFDLRFDPEILGEYFALGRTFGVETPLEGIQLLPPGRVTEFDLHTRTCQSDTYWSPTYSPLDKPFSYFVDEFVKRFRAAMEDRTRASADYGLLLSGGSDSRLLLAGLSELCEPTAYHMAEWMNTETRTAERVALTAGVDFELLRRDADYVPSALEKTPALSNFSGRFDQAHPIGFMDRLGNEVDTVFEGSSANTLFRGHHALVYQIPLGQIGTLDLPVCKPLDGIDSYLDYWSTDLPSYLDLSTELDGILSDRIDMKNGAVFHHEIVYDSPRDLVACAPIVPRTNAHSIFMAQCIRQYVSYGNPFLDNRLLDLALSMPFTYQLRRNIINAAVQRIDPELASIPHASTGISLTYPYPVQYGFRNGRAFLKRLKELRNRGQQSLPGPHMSHGPWPNHAKLIRSTSFVEDALSEHEERIRELPFLDWDGVRECYNEHLQGTDRTGELYRLITFLEMPVTARATVPTVDS